MIQRDKTIEMNSTRISYRLNNQLTYLPTSSHNFDEEETKRCLYLSLAHLLLASLLLANPRKRGMGEAIIVLSNHFYYL